MPRPPWTSSRVCRTTLPTLLEATRGLLCKAAFERLKLHVQTRAPPLQLNTYAPPDAQDPAKWRDFVDDCRSACPALANFGRVARGVLLLSLGVLARRVQEAATTEGGYRGH